MKIAIMQPYFLPYPGYWQLINAVDKFIVFDDVNFIKKGWINRNNILLNNKAYLFSLPLDKPSQNKLINETYFLDDKKAKENLLKTITLAYRKAPYYNSVFALLEKIILNPETNVAKYIKESFDAVLEYLSIEKEIKFSSDIDIDEKLKGQDRIIALCKKLDTNIYINAIGGQELYNKKDFDKKNIELKFIKMNEIKYKQFDNDFIPNLSIIDVLMFNSPETIKSTLNNYTLI